MATETIEVAVILSILLIFSIIAFKKKSLDKEGVLFANIIGILAYILLGINGFAALIIFFVAAELCTRIGRKDKKVSYEKRTIGNIFGNSAPSIICLVLGFPIGFFGSLSAALADTLSSEIGSLSKSKPVLITNWGKKVEPGTDGGVSLHGNLAMIFGALIIAVFFFLFNPTAKVFNTTILFGIIFSAGIIGSTVDSLLGATFERKRKLDNTQVNFIASAIGGIFAITMKFVLGI